MIPAFPVHALLGWVLCEQRESGNTDENSELCQGMGEEPQETLLSKNTPVSERKTVIRGGEKCPW